MDESYMNEYKEIKLCLPRGIVKRIKEAELNNEKVYIVCSRQSGKSILREYLDFLGELHYAE